MLLLLSFAPPEALAQTFPLDRPYVPSAGMATEGGPGAMWVNPANLAYDPDPRYGVYLTSESPDRPSTMSLLGGASGFGFGLHTVYTPIEGADADTDLALDYATSLPLPRRFAAGVRVSWHLADEGNFVAYDAGGSWRPLPWFGVSAVARNIGEPDPSALAQSGVGVALRPLGQFLALGLDATHTFVDSDDQVPDPATDVATLTARLRPIEGLYVRAHADSEQNVGVGVELFFGGGGVGAHGMSTAGGDRAGSLFVGTDEPGEAVIGAGNKVPVLRLDRTPPYEQRGGLFTERETTWLQTVELLRRAEEDRSIQGIVLVLDGAGLTWAHAQEIRNRIVSLETQGKPTVAYLHGGTGNADLFVASAASKVYMHPAQDLMLTGVAAEMTYLRGALDWVGVEPQFVRRAEYKSAVEQYTNSEPSPASLEQTNALLDDLDEFLVEGIAAGRKKDVADVRAWIDGGPWTATEAVEKGMIDGLAYPHEVEGLAEDTHGGNINFMALEELPQPHSGWKTPSQVAVVYVTGAIVPGKSSPGGLFGGTTTGSETVVHQLDQAREDGQVKAVVLRVDSPGGSSFASDEIHRAVMRLKDEGKPVIVSMGGYAASGGYYVSAGADEIWAEPTTITGSIGVFSGKFAMAGLYDRVGVTTTMITRGRNAGIHSSVQPWDEVQRARMQALVDHIYADFKQRVADGRKMPIEKVEEVARGHVWSGHRAMEVGLVDGMGGLHDAIKAARVAAGIPDGRDVQLVTYDGRGVLLEALSPTQMRGVRVAEILAPRQVAALRARAEAPRLADGFALLALQAQLDDEPWMMDPWMLRVDPE
jgi:protease-4